MLDEEFIFHGEVHFHAYKEAEWARKKGEVKKEVERSFVETLQKETFIENMWSGHFGAD